MADRVQNFHALSKTYLGVVDHETKRTVTYQLMSKNAPFKGNAKITVSKSGRIRRK